MQLDINTELPKIEFRSVGPATDCSHGVDVQSSVPAYLSRRIMGSSGFYGNNLKKKLRKNEWKDFWVVLKDKRLLFLDEREGSVCGILELSERTTCTVVGPSKCRPQNLLSTRTNEHNEQPSEDCKEYKFKVRSKRGFHLFKTQSLNECHRWIDAITETVNHLLYPSNSEVTSALLEEQSSDVNTSQAACDAFCCAGTIGEKNAVSSKEVNRHSASSFRRGTSISAGRLRRSLRSLRAFKLELTGDSYNVLQ